MAGGWWLVVSGRKDKITPPEAFRLVRRGANTMWTVPYPSYRVKADALDVAWRNRQLSAPFLHESANSHLTNGEDKGDNNPIMSTKRQADIDTFFAGHPVFSLGEAERALRPTGGRRGTVERLKYHVETGRLKRVAREVYAVAPRGQQAEHFEPDQFLCALAARPDAVFCCHSALELLGTAHSVWHTCTVFTGRRRPAMQVNNRQVLFLAHPAPMRDGQVLLGTRKVEHLGRLLTVTGPERTLVEGFRRLDLVGGAGEFVESVRGFAVLDIDTLEAVLAHYGIAYLWGAVGWFLEMYRETFHVPEAFLAKLEARCPQAPQYLARERRGGTLAQRWNLVLPPELEHVGERDAG